MTARGLPAATAEPSARPGRDAPPLGGWRSLADQDLDALSEQSLAGNLDLAAAWERLREAGAIARRESGALWPELDGSAEAGVTEPDQPTGSEDLRIGLAAAYEFDLWGRLSSRADAAALGFAAQAADYRAAALTLSAEVARTWYQLAAARQQVELLAAQVRANRDLLTLLDNRYAGGQVRAVDLFRQEQLLESTREQLFAAEARRDVLEHLLAVLLGQPAQNPLPITPGDFPTLGDYPATGLPARLVQRRPDIRAAWLRLDAADNELAAAVADQYPRLDLTASLTTAGEDASDLFDDWVRSFSGRLLAPLFRGGALRAEVDRAEAARNEAIYAYGQATLEAFQEVENALVRESQQRRRIASLERQVDLGERASEQLRVAYFNGVGDYIDVLSALTQLQTLRRDLIDARGLLVEYRIALHRALAGGFETPRELEAAPDPPSSS